MAKGKIEIITGPMFSGKSSELLRRIERVKIADKKVLAFKPKIDNRDSINKIASRRGNAVSCTPLEKINNIYNFNQEIKEVDVIIFDEAQFFDKKIVDICEELADRGLRVIVSGLDMDYLKEPFKTISRLLAKAEKVLKLSAICVDCGSEAYYTKRKNGNGNRIEIGDKNIYKAVCRDCY